MPGMVAGTSSRGSRRTTTAKSATAGRTSSPATTIPDEGDHSSLRTAICSLFADSQKTATGHRKAVISLRKLQEACCYEPVNQTKNRQNEDFDEDDFNNEVVRCVLRILPVKKSEPVGDRTVKFLGTFLNVASNKDNEIIQQDDPDITSLPETPTSRLTTQILGTLLPLLQAKEKTIRFRATQITSHIVNSLDTLDDNLFHQLRHHLLKRIHDKEAPVRLQAVYGLGRLAAEVQNDEEQEDSDLDDEGSGVLQKLLVVLQHDPSAEVRRNLLLNLPLTKEVLPYLLERARDADASTRRALYARLLPALGDFRHLGLTHRDKVLRWGLRDRDESVRKATAKLFCERWIEDCAALPAAQAAEQAGDGAEEEKQVQKVGNQAAAPSLDALLELLERIDVVNSGGEGGIALVAMAEFWQGRPDYFQYVSFPDTFWDDLSPELAFVARTFNDHCRANRLDAVIEERLPEVTKFGFLLEREIKRLIEITMENATQEDPELEEALVHREFVVEQMLEMALTFDYSDEVGRRKMYGLLRDSLGQPDLGEEVTRLIVENLRLNCGDGKKGEDQFCSIVVEVIADIHDTIMGEGDTVEPDSSVEESFHSATSHFDGDTASAAQKGSKKNDRKTPEVDAEADADREIRQFMINMKCLHIALCTLQNVQCDLADNIHLVTMLDNLIVPAIRDQRTPVRERGILCLGLCCLLGKEIAQENFGVFMQFFKKGNAEMRTIAIQIITDIIIAHPSLLGEPDVSATSETTAAEDFLKPVIKMFKAAIKSEDPTIQATGAVAVSKAMLSRLITDTSLLSQLVVVYFDPDTANNAQLRQSLNYFLPVYCHSNIANAERMVEVACGIISKLVTLKDVFEHEDGDAEAGDDMIKISKAAEMLLDWTDPRKIVGLSDTGHNAVSAETHFQLAEAVLERLVTSSISSKDEKKALLSMLGKLHLSPAGCNLERLKATLELVTEAIEMKLAVDKPSTETLKKLHATLLNLVRDAATAERGGEETAVETTELDPTIRPSNGLAGSDDDEELEEDSDVTQLQREMRESTVGFTTGLPDAEGTRIHLGVDDEDSEMMDVDDE